MISISWVKPIHQRWRVGGISRTNSRSTVGGSKKMPPKCKKTYKRARWFQDLHTKSILFKSTLDTTSDFYLSKWSITLLLFCLSCILSLGLFILLMIWFSLTNEHQPQKNKETLFFLLERTLQASQSELKLENSWDMNKKRWLSLVDTMGIPWGFNGKFMDSWSTPINNRTPLAPAVVGSKQWIKRRRAVWLMNVKMRLSNI